ncbi:MAG: hypothetical protein H0X29_02455 [Parachlamydiaceae bacterium]|nr:hypothetical protein [Parachlamydiaceae bacterium]
MATKLNFHLFTYKIFYKKFWEVIIASGFESLNNKIFELNSFIIRSDDDLINYDKKVNDLSSFVNRFLDSSMDEFFIAKKENIFKMRNIKFRLSGLDKKVLRFNPTSKDAVKSKSHSIEIIEKNSKLLDQAIITGKHEFSPLKRRDDTEFYLSYASFTKAKDIWRKSLFAERMNWVDCTKDAKKHPEWPVFNEAMAKHIKTPEIIEEMWNLTIHGIEKQLQLNKADKKKDPNPEFEKLAELLNIHGLLSPKPGEPFALWSGGFDLSLHAQSHNFTTLEKTTAGQIFDALSLYPAWGPLGPLWNKLSSQFAKNAGSDVHVFFRVQDPLSVLERQELATISTSPVVKNIIFHPMINKGDSLNELNVQEIPINSKNPKKDARIFLKDVLVQISQRAIKNMDPDIVALYKKNLKAIEKMKLD